LMTLEIAQYRAELGFESPPSRMKNHLPAFQYRLVSGLQSPRDHPTWSSENLQSTFIKFQDVAVIVLQVPLNERVTSKQRAIPR
jgi:hypothetical protein